MVPHVQEDSPFALCLFARLALRRFVDDYELSDVSAY